MADRDRDYTESELVTEGRERRQKRVLPKSLLRLLIILAAIIVAVVIIVVAARSAIRSGEAADYQKYMTSVADILESSDSVGAQLEELLTSPGDTNRTKIQASLDKFVASSEELKVAADALEAPKEMVDLGIHQHFLLVMSLREKGLSELKPALMNALEVTDTEVTSERISYSLRCLTNSDFLYEEVYIPQARDVLTKREMTGVTVPTTKFLSDPDIASTRSVLDILERLKSSGNLQAIHGVALSKVVAMPDSKQITAEGTFNLTSSDELAFDVTVENQGNMDEKNVKVVITLLSSESSEPQKVTKEIPLIKAKKEVTVTVEGLRPAPYGEVATLKVKAGPVPDEKYSENNVIEANVIFKL